MKKLILTVLSLLTLACSTISQDIYSAGYYTNGALRQAAAVYKNGSKLYNSNPENGLTHKGTSVVFLNGDVYWTLNCTNPDGPLYANIMRNNSTYLDSPENERRWIHAMTHFDNNLYAVGYMDINGVKTAVTWKNDDYNPYIILGDTNFPSEATCAMYVGETSDNTCLYMGGYQHTSSEAFHGLVWCGTNVKHTFPEGTKICGIAFYNGIVYSVGYAKQGNSYSLKVWEGESVKYTLSSSAYAQMERASICIDAGDIYVTGYANGPDKVWKNGTQIYVTQNGYFQSVVTNSNGVYYSGSDGLGKIWRDDSVIHSPNDCSRVMNLYIDKPECESNDILSMPFYDGFENGSTTWPCWTTIDVDNDNPDGRVSYWSRLGKNAAVQPYAGNHCILHRSNGNAQEGWLVSPKILLQSDSDYIALSFMSYEESSQGYGYEGVWVSTTGTDTADFIELWTQTDASETWKEITIDLSDYQGQEVYFAFKYSGADSHNWLIDDVRIDTYDAVKEDEEKCFSVYPNPAGEVIRIIGLEAETVVRVYNSLGELVKVALATADSGIGVDELTAGLYIVRFGDVSLRFVKTM